MTITTFVNLLSSIIPIATFASLVVSVFLYVKYKGTMDALKAAVETYKTLAEAYRVQISDMEEQIASNTREIESLKAQVEVQKAATQLAVDATIAGFAKRGYCQKAGECQHFVAGENVSGHDR